MKNGLIINKYGTKCYYLNDKYHREDGPAVEHLNGDKRWYQNDNLHRLDGPAIEWSGNSLKSWYFHGKHIKCRSQEEFEEQIKLAMFW
jgi:hypothetical protein